MVTAGRGREGEELGGRRDPICQQGLFLEGALGEHSLSLSSDFSYGGWLQSGERLQACLELNLDLD